MAGKKARLAAKRNKQQKANVAAKKAASSGGGGKGGFGARYGGAIKKGYKPSEAAAIAHGGSNQESLEPGVRRALESMFPNGLPEIR